MRIVVHYDNPDEQKLAERIVPDIEALANFAAAALQTRTGVLDVYTQRSDRGYTIDDLQALKWADNPALPKTILGGGGSGHNTSGTTGVPKGVVAVTHHNVISNPVQDQSGWAAGGGRMQSKPGDMVYLGDIATNTKMYGVLSEPDDAGNMTATLQVHTNEIPPGFEALGKIDAEGSVS